MSSGLSIENLCNSYVILHSGTGDFPKKMNNDYTFSRNLEHCGPIGFWHTYSMDFQRITILLFHHIYMV